MCGAIAFISVSIEFGVNTELIRCFPFPQGSFDLANVEHGLLMTRNTFALCTLPIRAIAAAIKYVLLYFTPRKLGTHK